MESSDSRTMPDRTGLADLSNVSPASSTGIRSLSPPRGWALVLAAALAAGLISWAGVEAARNFFKPRLFEIQLVDGSTAYEPTLASQRAADRKNLALAFAVQGGILALAMGLAGGLAIGSPGRGLAIGLGAQAAGALAGAGATLGLLPIIYRNHVPDPNDLLTPLLVQAGIWMAVGAVAGPTLAVGMGSFRRLFDATWGAILGAFLAAGVFRLIHGVLSPASDPMVIIATDSRSRLVAAFCLVILVAAGAANGAIVRTARRSLSADARGIA